MNSSKPTGIVDDRTSDGAAAVPTPAPAPAPDDLTTLGAEASQAVAGLLAQGKSANTDTSYETARRYWRGWFRLRYGAEDLPMPVPVSAVLQFIVDHAQREDADGTLRTELPPDVDLALVAARLKKQLGPPALATLLHRLSVLAADHHLSGFASPTSDGGVKELLKRTRRAYAKRGVVPDKKAALSIEPLEALLATCDDSPRGVRDRALLLFAWSSGGRRRSEVAAATMENTKRVGKRAFVYTLGVSKTNQAGAARPEDSKPIVDRAADALEAWLALSHISSGPIFVRILPNGRLGAGLAPAAVRDIVMSRAKRAKLPPDLSADLFSAHSLRSGFVTEASRQNMPLAETMALSGHTSVASVVGYVRAADSVKSQAARLAGEEPKRSG